nr:immunoglobulin heavy chain junction region [Mus musculus]MBK4184933.1 immunoglobulin heavy chain junction region [Mus musculus]
CARASYGNYGGFAYW